MITDRGTLIFVELALALLLGVILGGVARFFRQPLILAYIVTGIVISSLGVSRLGTSDVLPLLANFGVIFLLFLVGLELKLSDLKYFGKSAIITGLVQLTATFLVGFLITKILGFPLTSVVYLAVALTFSSTIIVVKLLSEKKDLNSLYGKITIAILLIQDLVAIFALIFLAGFNPVSGNLIDPTQFLLVVVKGIIVVLTAILLNRFILPVTFNYSAQSAELLLITALSWCFIFAAFTKLVGFSLEIGAFLAGVAIASSPFQLQISTRVRPLRDFFTVIFFIFLGINMSIFALQQLIVPILVLSALVLIAKPAMVLTIMGFLGHTKRTSFLTALTLAQISEFSLIVIAVGAKLGHIPPEIVSLVAAIGIITITVSSYLILYSNWIYKKFAPYLDIFERQAVKETKKQSTRELGNHVILVGCEQVGRDVLRSLERKLQDLQKIVVIDFNPSVIDNLKANGVNAIFGDIADHELLEELNLAKAKLIISTIPDVNDNLTLLQAAKEEGFTGPLILTAYWVKDGVKLYETGADFVLVPELAGGDKIVRILGEHWENLTELKQNKSRYLEELLEKG